MGLSPDPEKRARQLANLEKGFPRAAAKHGLATPNPKPPEDPPEEHEPEPEPEPRPTLEVMDYDTPKPPEAKPEPPARADPEPGDPEPGDREPEPRRGPLGELWAGLTGG